MVISAGVPYRGFMLIFAGTFANPSVVCSLRFLAPINLKPLHASSNVICPCGILKQEEVK